MASWTDAITQFNPYVSTLPVDAMVKVGMQKQAMYEQGVQKIQSEIDQVAGLSMLRDVDKNYLQTKLNELGNNLTSVAAADFSNFNLVNSVAGMTKQISRDPFVQAAVSSTEHDRKQQELMDADRKKGTLTPDNEIYYSKQRSKYLNSGLKDENGKPITFSGQYIPNFDVFKFAKESFDAVKPDGYSFDQIYMMDANGKPMVDSKGSLILNPTMTRIEREGVFPAKVKETLDQIFSDPRVARQLQITGEYNYGSYDENALAQKILKQKGDIMNDYKIQLVELGNQKKAGKDVQSQIDAIQKNMVNLNSSYNEYAQLAMSNPDAIRGLLYKDDVTHRYTTMFGWEKKKELVMDNPRWRAEFDMQKEANARSQWAQEFAYTKERDKIEDEKWQRKYDQDERHFLMEQLGKGKDATGKEKGTYGATTGPAELTPTIADEDATLDVNGLFNSDATEIYNKYFDDLNEIAFEGLKSSLNFTYTPEWMKKTGVTMPDEGDVFNLQGKLDEKLKKYNGNRQQALREVLSEFIPASDANDSQKNTMIYAHDAVVNWNKLSAAEKDKNPLLRDKMVSYLQSVKRFNEMNNKVNDINTKAKAITPGYGDYEKWRKENPRYSKFYNYNVGGKNVVIGPNELEDLSLYVMTRQGLVSRTGTKENANKISDEAYKRLKARGLEGVANEVLTAYRMVPSNVLANPITGIYSSLKWGFTNTEKEGVAGAAELSGRVKEMADVIYNKGYIDYLINRANVIKEVYSKKPNLKVPLLSGKPETDRGTIQQLRSMVGEYKNKQVQNLAGSSEFNSFAKSLDVKDPSDIGLQARIIPGGGTEKLVEIVSYNKSGDKLGRMVIQQDEALSLGINPESLYENSEISILRSKLNKEGKSSYGDPSRVDTYLNGDSYFGKYEIPSMSNSKLDIQANVVNEGGVYYAYVYVSDGQTSTVRPLPAERELETAVNKIKSIPPQLAETILMEEKNKNKK